MIDWLNRASADPELELNAERVPIVLKRHSTAKRMTMRLAPDGSEVRITLPRWARSAEAIAFANARKEWLEEQLRKLPKQCAPVPGDMVRFRGREVQLAWDKARARKPVLEGDQLTLGGPESGIEARLKRWLEQEALTLFESDIAHYTAVAALDPVPVGISRAHRRWGSCSDGGPSKAKRIRLNWRLVQAPDFVRRSVAAHEVVHLVHFDHSPAFHALLDEIYEGDIKLADQWLKANGRSLYTQFG